MKKGVKAGEKKRNAQKKLDGISYPEFTAENRVKSR